MVFLQKSAISPFRKATGVAPGVVDLRQIFR